MRWLAFDEQALTVGHDLWRWIWWEPGDTPRAGDERAARRTQLRWEDIVRLDATGPWPKLEIHYHAEANIRRLQLEPRGELPAEFLAHMRKLFEFATRHVDPGDVRSGWVTAPDVMWEHLERWPEEQEAVLTPYRGAVNHEQWRAMRDKPSAYEAMLQWLASTPERPWREHPRRVLVTSSRVCVERRDKKPVAIARSLIRGRRRTADGDRAYYFGRRERLLLPLRGQNCPVTWALDQDVLAYVGPD